jgi:hypothetical protein
LIIGAAAQKNSRLINEISDSSTLEIILSDTSKKWREYVYWRLQQNALKQTNSLPECPLDTPAPTTSAYRNGVLLPICGETVQRSDFETTDSADEEETGAGAEKQKDRCSASGPAPADCSCPVFLVCGICG